MYTAYLDETCILDAKHEILLENPTLELADNEAGSFTFTIYKNNPGYNLIKMLTGIVTVKWDDEVLFKGRIINSEKSFEKALTVECEGELAYLADSIQRPAEYHELTVYAYVAKLVELHNAQVGADKRFEVGAVTVTDSNDSLYRYTNWESTLDVFNSDLLNSLGGHLRVRYDGTHRYLDYLADYPRLSGQRIEFGENLLTYTESNSALELATVCIPLGARREESSIEALEERLTVKSVNNGKDYIELSAAVQAYGRVTKTVIWDGVNTPSVLLAKGQKWLQDNQYEVLELSLTAVDLADFGVDVDHLRLLDRIHCTSSPHGMDHEFPLTSLSITLTDPTQNIYTLGSKLKTFSKSTGRAQKVVQAQLENSPSKSNVLKQALDNATQLITMVGKDGHVIFSPSVSEPNELYIIDYDNLEDAQRCWRWNLNGLGYSSSGKDGPFELAITMDGTIAGRFIAAGTIGADQINVSYTSTQEKKWQDELGNNYWKASTIQTKIENNAEAVLLAASEQLEDYYTKAEINVQTNMLATMVQEKIGEEEFGSLIEQNAKTIRLMADEVVWVSTYSSMDESGILTTQDQYIAGAIHACKNRFYWGNPATYSQERELSDENYMIYKPTPLAGEFMSAGAYGFQYYSNGVLSHLGERRLSFFSTSTIGSDAQGFALNKRENMIASFGPYLQNGATLPMLGLSYPTHYSIAFQTETDGYQHCAQFSPYYSSIQGNVSLGGNSNTVSSSIVYVVNDLRVNGTIICSNTKSRVADTAEHGNRLLYCYEMPTPYFGDVGEGTVGEDGYIRIPIDPVFAQTVFDLSYQVFITNYDEGSVYVEERKSSYFLVKGTPGLHFGWELKARQLGFESLRLENQDLRFTQPCLTSDFAAEAAAHIKSIQKERGL